MVRVYGLAAGVVLIAFAVADGQNAPPTPPPNPPPRSQEVRIGFPEALFKDVPKPLIQAAAIPFQRMIQKEIAMDGTLVIVPDYAALTNDLNSGKVDIAVFHGFEYAWVKHNLGFTPIVITNPSCGKVQACLVVNNNCKAKNIHQLKGACVAVPKGSKAHCQMFLERLREKEKLGEGDCSPKPSKAEGLTPEEALDEVVSGTCEAALVDISSFLNYQAFRPGLGKQLKIIAESELLPSAVVVIRKGALNAAQINKVRDGLLNCNKTPAGRAFAMFWQLNGFKEVTEGYLQMLDKTLKDYPPPPQANVAMPSGPK